MGQRNSHLQPGDLIEIDRPLHQHWALYLGDGYVINLTPAGKQTINLGAHKVPVFTRKVTKQLLKKVVRKNKWRVNNKSNEKHTPLPVEEIIQRAEGYIGKEVTYRGFGSNCECFVKKLRYGDQLRAFVHGEVHTPDITDDKCEPMPGDLIEIKRQGYQHWALYVGDGYVIHVTDVDENAPPVSASTAIRFTKKGMVKMELLKEVAGNGDWDVSNEYDCYCTPLPVEEIIQRAEGYIGKEVTYRGFDSICEFFVKELRYGDQLRAFVFGEVQTPDMTDDKCDPRPGDLIEIKRPIYQHWAVYVGDGYVIHVTELDEKASPVSASTATILTRKAKVKMQLLKEVAGNNTWRVNNKYDCDRAPFPMEEIVRRAERWIDREVPYDVLGSNCEHFVTMLRYGEGVSGQVKTALKRSRGISTAVVGIGAASISPLLGPLAPASVVNLLASLGLISRGLGQFFTRVKVFKAQRDILEQMCC